MRKSSEILKDKSGASMLFVLAVMLLLTAVGASALTAASANAGAGINKHTLNQLNLYAGSIQKSVMYSLQACRGDDGKDILSNEPGNMPATLGGQIARAICNEALASPDENDPDVLYYTYAGKKDVKITPALDGDEDILSDVKSIIISADSIVYVRKDYDEEQPVYGADGEETGTNTVYYPREVTIGAEVTVTVKASHKGKSLTSVAAYNYSGGIFANQGEETGGPYDSGALFIENAGEWELVSYETIDK